MPELFPDLITYLLCALVIVGAQLIYATVGFGAGMFSVALLALILPDLRGVVATLLLVTLVTEIWVLMRAGRQGDFRLLVWLLPTMAIGMWLGTGVLVSEDVNTLKRILGLVIIAAGGWFLISERNHRRAAPIEQENPPEIGKPPHGWLHRAGWSIPAGFVSGVLGGMFGTGGPPVIVFLKSYRLSKGAFRATILWYFLSMSVIRAGAYLNAGVLGRQELWAALWLLPATLLGTALGMVVHDRVSDRQFGIVVSVLLVALGAMLALGRGQ